MKARIDNHHMLFLERGGEEIAQACPYLMGDKIRCGDWCPRFEVEPEYELVVGGPTSKGKPTGLVTLLTCGPTRQHVDLTDERET